MITVTCNGEPRQVDDGTTVGALIVSLGMEPDHVVVEYNGRILERPQYDDQPLEEGAVLEIMRFVGGG
jgi:thiamine biosynthesis protein ThiS